MPPHPTRVNRPIRRSVLVSWDPRAAFHRFTADFGAWWPKATHSIGGKQVQQIIFECRVGGRIIEELQDGRRYLWGRIIGWDPPRRVAFTWHPAQDEQQAQDVEVTFDPEGSGTRVELVSTGWERLSPSARRARKGYDIGWGAVLDVFARRRSAAIVIFAMMSGLITLFLRMTGRLERSINQADGRLPPALKDSSEGVEP